ncbi:acyl-CoA thioesterase-2 [Sinobacterium caligoides]|uniref:Acyl-CoA thioesterase 2 n=1 Tax=Sinobacterium caligoides TaxID=933926 RepID=A0A3N2DMD4_9GAMM|nr:acyl-CoA thioesterase domain-containing protein [Sinobacterium caligoides]ROS00971.1 acyl-CoA thioesterase-2 [Sinobacterium caligoides]
MADRALRQLIRHLDLHRINANLYSSTGNDDSLGRLYGGEILAQALAAADQSVDGDLNCHSLHGHFLHLGKPGIPVQYHIERLRDSRSFSTRRVTAKQSGRAIFSAMISYQIPQQGFEHQTAIDIEDYPQPEGLASCEERYQSALPEEFQGIYGWPMEFRQVNPVDLLKPNAATTQHAVWFKAPVSNNTPPALHRQLMLYASDNPLLLTALRPHGQTNWSPNMQVASLDHAIWFHQPCRADQWLLFVLDSPRACAGRGLAQGHIYNQAGMLIASVAQEGVMRHIE